jgi:hypothetical protein
VSFGKHASSVTCQYCGTQVLHKRTMLPHMLQRTRQPAPPRPQQPRPHPRPTQKKGSPVLVLVSMGIFLSAAMGFVAFFVMARSSPNSNRAPEPVSITVEPGTTTQVYSFSTSTTVDDPINQPQTNPADLESRKGKPKHRKNGKRRAKGEDKKAKGEGQASAPAEQEVGAKNASELSAATARRVFRRVHMLHCGGEGNIKVNVTILPNGKLSQASPQPQDEVGSCVADTVKSLRFPASADGLTTSHRYKW